MDGLVFKRAFFFNDKGQNSSSKNQQQDLHVLSPQYKKYLIQIRDRERKVIIKSNGEVLLFLKIGHLKVSATYKFLKECLSFRTNTPLRAVNMHA